MMGERPTAQEGLFYKSSLDPSQPIICLSCCRFGGHLVKVFTRSEDHDGTSDIQPRVQAGGS
jgi:hypothetical protein